MTDFESTKDLHSELRRDASAVAVYCDGSLGPAVMSDPTTSSIGDSLIGRTLVLVPARDVGVLERCAEATSSLVEAAAIRRALESCAKWRIADVIVWSDSMGEVRAFGDVRVQWRSRGKNPAGWFLERLMSRASYLRSTNRTGSLRRRITDAQEEIFRMLASSTPRQEFALSRSAIWTELKKKHLWEARKEVQ